MPEADIVPSNRMAIDLIRQALATGVIHPGDDKTEPFALPALPAYQLAKLPPEQAEHFANEAGLPSTDFALLTAEALVYTLQGAGHTLINTTELERLRAIGAEADAAREVTLECICGQKCVSCAMTQVNPGKFRVNGRQLITAMRQLDPDCSTQHRGRP